ncbi:glycosyltransferase family 2 protein [Rhizobium sp. LCM 4573]|uniref:glycosyltransferase family 2 protein n=1 Tax=Rhizobium sp. LCM 4573 TaxID=1848291 RepID=UPI0008D9EA6E|nr:glycosyltransferase family 2 protein [Rhizobium sp. LCM 4573]OHV84981.1 hypothetical protein LCM4573_04900 [Rhizobium sp. LCM 4573]
MLHYILSSTAIMLSIALFIPTAIFVIECIAGSISKQNRTNIPVHHRPSAAILVPAHNEELNITDTVLDIQNRMREGDRLIVIADNCTDYTAALARSAGAEVVERNDVMRRGKGYALDAGMNYLAATPAEVVVIVDADCRLHPDALDRLVSMASATGKPVQSRYLLSAPRGAGAGIAVSEFAVLLKNRIRLRGLSTLGLPAQLTGSGMAFPWQVLRQAELASGNLVEDMKLGLDLARAGHEPRYCDEAVVTSEFPCTKKGLETQATRWEAGRFALMKPLLSALFDPDTFRSPNYLLLVLDALVPPVTLLTALLLLSLAAAALLAAIGGTTLPLLVSAVSLMSFSAALITAWWIWGRDVLPLDALGRLPGFALTKLKLYPHQAIAAGSATWVRTDRERFPGA